MSIEINLPESFDLKPKIIVIGVGGAGGNAVNSMISSNLVGVEYWALNTDAQALKGMLTPNRIQLGLKTTGGLGAGSHPEIGKQAAEESIKEISEIMEGAHMVFITCGFGGGTGTGAAPVVAKIAKEKGVLTVAVVTKPFHFEGTRRMKLAELGLKALKEVTNTVIVIPNQNLFRVANENTTVLQAFELANNVLRDGVGAITDLITNPGLINLDFADIKTVMSEMGKAMMGTGEAEGENAAIVATEKALSNPLLENINTKGARAAIINISGGPKMTLYDVDKAANLVKEWLDSNANIIFGSAFNPDLDGIRVSIVATGIDDKSMQSTSPANLNDNEGIFSLGVTRNDKFDQDSASEDEDEDEGNEGAFIPSKPVEPALYADNALASANGAVFKSFEEEVEELDIKSKFSLNEKNEDYPSPEPENKVVEEQQEMKKEKEDFFDIPAFIRKKMGMK